MDYLRNDRFCPVCRMARGQNPSYYTPKEDPICPTPQRVNAVENPTSLAMVYSPKQPFADLYEPIKALSRGTLFVALDKPFTPCRR